MQRSIWECQCECGGTAQVDLSALQSGRTRSCGCLEAAGIRRHAENISVAVRDPQGRTYPSQQAAADARGVSHQRIHQLVNASRSGWERMVSDSDAPTSMHQT